MTKKTALLLSFILLKFALQYILISPEYELQRDEFLHLDQAHHLAWGYLSVPPVTSWISYIIYSLGNSIFWIRFFPALFGALTLFVVWKSIEELKGNTFALLLGATSVLFSALLRINGLYQPNSLDVLCWTTFCFILIKYTNTESSKWFYIGMLVLAFGFLNKYNIVFLLVGVFPALLLTNRSAFKNKNFYFSILLFLLLILPNLIWQYNNNFPVYHHMQILAKTQLVNVNRWDFLKDQLFFFIGSLYVILVALYGFLFYPPFKKYRFFFWTLVFTLIVFTYLKAKSYYAIGLYPIYIAFGAVYLETILKSGWKKYLQPVAIAIPILLFIPISKIMFPNKSPEYIANHSETYKKFGLLRWEDGKDHKLPQDYADMLGWKELAHKTDSIYATLPKGERTLILCDNYGQAGAINYYTKNKNITALSFNADYVNWFQLDKKYVNLIRIKELNNEETELEETSPFFEKSYIGGSITNLLAREYGTTIFVFEKAKIDINQRIKTEIEAEKKY
ncbi:glycosyltransferase family 39 protein [Flavobacterium sp. N3904]|uniref:glycosyltransferase family 39 protein n=1 Tax=Flavobacterium sp. N3904 TaxID=2986835 RepID=UPI00222564BD|nr:glycosyltransferase family 39 protein [Flavobacterium sp. N3904]